MLAILAAASSFVPKCPTHTTVVANRLISSISVTYVLSSPPPPQSAQLQAGAQRDGSERTGYKT